MPSGYDAKLPLYYDGIDSFYALHKTTQSNIQQNVKMLMLTTPGERVMLPEYGVGLRNFLFENDPGPGLKEKIREQVGIFLSDIHIIAIDIDRDEQHNAALTGQKNTLRIRMEYLIKGTSLKDSLTLVEEAIT